MVKKSIKHNFKINIIKLNYGYVYLTLILKELFINNIGKWFNDQTGNHLYVIWIDKIYSNNILYTHLNRSITHYLITRITKYRESADH